MNFCYNKIFIKHLCFWFLTISAIYLISFFPNFIELFFFNFLYPIIALINRFIYRFFPFSVGDIIYTIGLFYLFYIFIKILFNIRNIKKHCYSLSLYLLSVVWIFYLSWGFNYFRPSLSEKLNLDVSDYTLEELKDITDIIIKKTNKIQFEITSNDTIKVEIPYGIDNILNKTPEGYKEIKDVIKQKYIFPCIKKSLYSHWISFLHISGYLNPFTGEAQINSLYPKYALPFISSHEVAHQLGYAPEDEANFLGFISCIKHPDPFFKYSGYTTALYYLLIELQEEDTDYYKAILKKINKGVIKNYREESQFFFRYKTQYNMTEVYNSYLKLNKQKKGIKSYNEIIRLLVGYYRSL